MPITYEIEWDADLNEWVLYSRVPTNFGGDAVNFVAASSDKQVVENVRNQLGGK